MADEKVTLVKMMIVKLCAIIPHGYSKSTDKIGEAIKKEANSELNQFFGETNEDLN